VFSKVVAYTAVRDEEIGVIVVSSVGEVEFTSRNSKEVVGN